MRNTTQSATSLPLSPDEERRLRVIKYSITMSIRVVCIVMMLFVQGWWLALFGLGAVVLPYFAMLLANVKSAPSGVQAKRPSHFLVPTQRSERNE
jgi:ABC-type multidrug transport system fused ATPase/permease subunit